MGMLNRVVTALEAGRKIRRHAWHLGLFIEVGTRGEIYQKNQHTWSMLWKPTITDLAACDWEIFET